MIRISDEGWASDFDFARPARGRMDSPEVVEGCLRVLAQRTSRKFGKSRAAAVSIRQAGIQAQVARGGGAESTQLRRIRDLEATVNRLLTFVPTRTAPLDDEKITELSEHVYQWIHEIFGQCWAMATWSEDVDPMSTSLHRLTLRIDPGDRSPESFAEGTFALHRRLAGALRPSEREAVRMVVVARRADQ